jgi:hypothetical protein
VGLGKADDGVAVKTYYNLAMAFALTLASTGLSAQDNGPSIFTEGGARAVLGQIHAVELEIDDQVNDGCMPRPKDVLASGEAAMRRNHFDVKESTLFGPLVTFTAMGYDTGSGCAVFFSLAITHWRRLQIPGTHMLDDGPMETMAPITWTVYRTLLTGPKGDMQTRLEREAEKSANDLFIYIDKSRAFVKERWPDVWGVWSKEYFD